MILIIHSIVCLRATKGMINSDHTDYKPTQKIDEAVAYLLMNHMGLGQWHSSISQKEGRSQKCQL